MIRKYSEETLSLWNREKIRVQLLLPGQDRPMGYCDGSDEDEEEIRSMAREEGVDPLNIHKKYLKTGREIWTLGDMPERDPLLDED